MIRKTLATASLIGLVLSLAAWGASYWRVSYGAKWDIVMLVRGLVNWTHIAPLGLPPELRNFGVGGYSPYTSWLPRAVDPPTGATSHPSFFTRSGASWMFSLPLWIPALAFFLLVAQWPLARRRHRKLGLCVKCGYSLQGLSEPRCPECGAEFQA